jgi:protein required for attachment to host cells
MIMSQHILITVVDSAKARFLLLLPEELPSNSFVLTEYPGLVLPAMNSSGTELWSSSKTGRNRGPAGQDHSYDEHRQEHLIEFERHFADSIANQMSQMLQEHHLRSVLLVAAPKILGVMRSSLESVLPQTVKLTELAKDLCHLTPCEIQVYLAEQKFIPAPKRLGIS